MKKITIEDIAKATGVSRGTVSRAFNQRSDINKNTRRKILDAAQKLNYLPNQSARGLAKGKSECVGVVVPNLLNPFLAEMVTRLEVAVRAHGMSAILGIVDHDVELQESVLMRMASGQIDGLLITPCEGVESIKQINWINKRIPVVALKQFDGLDCDTVMCNDSMAIKLVVEHLLSLGHEKIVYISPRKPEWSVAQRLKAYHDSLDMLNINYKKHLHCNYNDHRDDNSELDKVIENLIKLKKRDMVTAVVAYDDIIAMQLIKQLHDRNMPVPEAFSIAGIDNIAFSQYGVVPLTSAACNTDKLCDAAIETLIYKLKNNDQDELRNVILKPKLYIRDSSRSLI